MPFLGAGTPCWAPSQARLSEAVMPLSRYTDTNHRNCYWSRHNFCRYHLHGHWSTSIVPTCALFYGRFWKNSWRVWWNWTYVCPYPFARQMCLQFCKVWAGLSLLLITFDLWTCISPFESALFEALSLHFAFRGCPSVTSNMFLEINILMSDLCKSSLIIIIVPFPKAL